MRKVGLRGKNDMNKHFKRGFAVISLIISRRLTDHQKQIKKKKRIKPENVSAVPLFENYTIVKL